MSEQKPLKHFPRIREARELLSAQAEELIQLKLRIAKEALEARDYEAADECINFLLLHSPVHEGVTVLTRSIDSANPVDLSPKGPQIQIGIQLGGMNKPKELLPSVSVIDIPVETPDNE